MSDAPIDDVSRLQAFFYALRHYRREIGLSPPVV